MKSTRTAAHWREPASACPELVLRGLRLRTAARVLLDGLDLSMRAGELWCIVGANGVGKSTLMAVLAGLRAPDGGAVLVDGQAPASIAPAALALRRALLPQAVHDTFSMSVRDAVRVGRHPHQSVWSWRWSDPHVDGI